MQTMGKQPKGGDYGFLRTKSDASGEPKRPKPLTSKDIEFMSRMDFDTDDRRRTAFITQLSARHHRARVDACFGCVLRPRNSHAARTATLVTAEQDPRFRPSMLEGPKPKFEDLA